MYVPKHFAETRPESLAELLRTVAFGTLVTVTPAGLEANPLPFVYKPDPPPWGVLQAHLARANTQWQTFDPSVEALFIVQGPDAYITPSWYPSKRETGKAVPTWNYVVVHAYGQLRVTEDPEWLRRHVEELTDQQERARPEPWRVTDAPAEYTAAMLKAIVGVELRITRLIGKWKLGQNRSLADRQGMAAGLASEGDEGSRALLPYVQDVARGRGGELP